MGVLELAVCAGDVYFIKLLVTKQGVNVEGKHLWFCLFPPTNNSLYGNRTLIDHHT